MYLPKKTHDFFVLHGIAQELTLEISTSEFNKSLVLLSVAYAGSINGDIDLVKKRDDGIRKNSGRRSGLEVRSEVTVKLDHGYRKKRDIVKRRITSSEVVERHGNTKIRELLQDGLYQREIRQKTLLGNIYDNVLEITS